MAKPKEFSVEIFKDKILGNETFWKEVIAELNKGTSVILKPRSNENARYDDLFEAGGK